MAIEIQVGDQGLQDPESETKAVEKEPQATVSLKIRRTMDGDLVVYDHEDLDIVIAPAANKIIAFPKDSVDEETYHSQMRLFKFLVKRGITDRSTIQGGSVYNAIEANILESNKDSVDPIEVVVQTISDFMESERPHFARKRQHEEREEERLTEPDDEESTELGEVPHADQKGGIQPGLYYRPYLTTYHYFYQQE
tara:strand:- start:556 stop:1140 length:585 start_codon:yes stop_codon:yes gene_type:complete